MLHDTLARSKVQGKTTYLNVDVTTVHVVDASVSSGKVQDRQQYSQKLMMNIQHLVELEERLMECLVLQGQARRE